MDSCQREGQRKKVHEDVRGIREQGQRVGPETADQLRNECDGGQDNRNDKATGNSLVQLAMIMMVVFVVIGHVEQKSFVIILGLRRE